jgi:rubrerythrin
LLAIARTLEQEAADRYRGLAERMARQGQAEMAARFDLLASIEERHAIHVTGRSQGLLGHPPDAARIRWELPAGYDEDKMRGAALDPYQALAFAVRNEERAFAFYTYIAAEADHPDIQALAEDLARDELQHAALLRHHRRRAFHAHRQGPTERPANVKALQTLARLWDAEAAAAHGALAKALEEAGEHDDAGIFRHLAERETDAAGDATGVTNGPILRGAADGLRILEEGFDRYALIGERADDEHVVAEAQRLAGEMVARLSLAGGARSNTLLNASPK